MSYHFSTKNFWKFDLFFTCFRANNIMDLRGLDDLFFLVFASFWAENWTSADLTILQQSALLLRSENIATMPLRHVAVTSRSNENV